MRLVIGSCLASCLLWSADENPPPPAASGDADHEAIQLRLPPQLEARLLAETLVEHLGVQLQFDPAKLNGNVRLVLPAEVTRAALWDLTNRALLTSGLAIVVQGEPPVYQLVPIAEAANHAEVMLPERLDALVRKPGYATVILKLQHLAAEQAVKALAAVLSNQVSQVRTFGQEQQRLVLSAPMPLIQQTQRILAVIDRPGTAPAVRQFRPQRTAAQALQTAANAAWTAAGRVSGRTTPAEFQLSPDGQQLLIVTMTEVVEEAIALVERLDQAEPVETRAYRPAHFGLEDVASLLTQVLKGARSTAVAPEIVRDRLTSRLVVTATIAQHERVAAILKELEQTPSSARRQLRSIPIRHRPVEDLAKILSLVLAGGAPSSGTAGGGTPASASGTPAAQAGEQASANQPVAPMAGPTAMPTTPAVGAASVSTGDAGVAITTDPPTNRLILLGEPQRLDQVMQVVEQLDLRQPQVQLEVILATLSSGQNRELGMELVSQFSRGETNISVGSLFGLSGGSSTARTLPAAASGLGAMVVRPGDFAGVLRALETVTSGDNLIRTRVVVVNNAKATINGVVQQPLTSVNSNNTVATAGVSGSTDAGTQISISPQISAADQVTLTYSIEQSSFIGSSTVTSSGAVIPAPKRSDTLSSIATIPDGHVIALGGLSSRSQTSSQSRIPFLGAIPVLGWPFQSRSSEASDSRFYVFIHANVLRQANFADLRRISGVNAKDMNVPTGWPSVAPQFTP